MINSLLQMQLKLHKKERFKKQQKQPVIRSQNNLKNFSKNNSETNEEGILREKYISPELRQKIIDDLRLKEENN